MSYFGGLGSGKGWNTFNFILTPKEFNSIFENQKYSFVITNSRVEIDYTETDKEFIFNSYKDFFNEIIIGDKKDYWIFEEKIRISITDDINKIQFNDIINKKGIVSSDFKLVSPTEPVINIRPLYLTYSKIKESPTIAYRNTEGTIGLELTYPKVVSFRKDDFKTLIDAHTFTTYNLFNNLIKNIKAISNKAKLEKGAKLFRPNFWISAEAKKVINENHYLKSNDLKIV
ncbi:hypothetical protein [Flavobacterium ginsengiterrae]|uniref:Uncharacterized protein n=1 Tax=Flavobacterium ginsengiterrae TaxID=871695 RepID=A0ABP7GZ36_9FLAO